MASLEYTGTRKLMGSFFSIKIIHHNRNEAIHLIEDAFSEIKRMECLLSEFIDESDIGKINLAAGKSKVKVEKEVFDLLQRSCEISRITKGAFDITIGKAKQLYSFDRSPSKLPKRNEVQASADSIGFSKIKFFDDNHIYLSDCQSKISLAAIGKGYAADQTKAFLQKRGVGSGVVNASGDITAWGINKKSQPWNIGIPHPDELDKILLQIPIFNKSIATSGSCFQYFTDGSQKYSHTLNPKTGLPITKIKSVSVVHPSAEVCDAFATAISVLGIEEGLNLVGRFEKIYTIIINNKNEICFSKNIEFNQ